MYGFWKKLNSVEVCTVRIHLAVTGYLALAGSSLFYGFVPWDEATSFDKVLSTVSLVFIIQGMLAYRTDLPVKLKWTYFLSILVFLYTIN